MGGHMYLAYELVERGSLEKVLYGPGHGCDLFDYPVRACAIGGMAQALAYLHHDCSPLKIHRDVTCCCTQTTSRGCPTSAGRGSSALAAPNAPASPAHCPLLTAGKF